MIRLHYFLSRIFSSFLNFHQQEKCQLIIRMDYLHMSTKENVANQKRLTHKI